MQTQPPITREPGLDLSLLFHNLKDAQTIFLAGAGGGFDIYAGIPLYFALKNMGKKVVIGNYSFTSLQETTAENVFPSCYKIKSWDRDKSGRNYFPEKYLKQWLEQAGETVDIYAFERRIGVQPLNKIYKYLHKQYNFDAVILIDGGTDSLMFGNEEGLGTPEEDMTSMAAAYKTDISRKYLVCIGFGIDHFHGVAHYHFLENVATLVKEGGFLGVFSALKEMPEVQQYIAAVKYANDQMQGMESIVSNSIVSAIEGEYGDFHTNKRTFGSELWINPLMSMFWCFDLKAVMKQNLYYHLIKNTNSLAELNAILFEFRKTVSIRPKKRLPI
jgi:hypothetical protein